MSQLFAEAQIGKLVADATDVCTVAVTRGPTASRTKHTKIVTPATRGIGRDRRGGRDTLTDVRLQRRRALMQAEPVPPLDRFTVGHGMIGFCLGLWGVPWWVALTSTLAFELIENFALKPHVPRIFPVGTPDTFANAAFDVTAWMGGWAMARAMFPAEHERAPIWRRR